MLNAEQSATAFRIKARKIKEWFKLHSDFRHLWLIWNINMIASGATMLGINGNDKLYYSPTATYEKLTAGERT